jgi:NTP pyrophosphatase (non-canonical NTP hydrolase)
MGTPPMTIDEYAQWAAGVPQPPAASRFDRLAYAALGLAGEAGEVADSIRRLMRDRTLNEDRLVYELGDLVFHWACLVAELGQLPSALLARSREQIEARLAAGATPTVERHP